MSRGPSLGKPSIKGVGRALSKASNDTKNAVQDAAKQAKDIGGTVLNPIINNIAPKGGTTKSILSKVREFGRKTNTSVNNNARSIGKFSENAIVQSHKKKPGESGEMSDEEIQAAADKAKADRAGPAASTPPPPPPPGFAGSSAGKVQSPISMVDNPTFDPRFKNAQTGLLTQLQDRAAGRGGPSLAEMQQKQAGNKAMQNTLGAVRAGTGSNAALAARTAALAGGNQMANLANESAILRMREQQDAQNAVAGLAAQGRQSGIGEAGLSMDAQKLNQASDLSQRNMMNEQDRAVLGSQTALATSAIDASGRVNAAAAGKPEESPWYNSLIAPLTSGLIAYANSPAEKALAKTTTGPTAPLPMGPQPGTNGDQIISTPQQAPAPQGPQAGPYDDSSQNTMSLTQAAPMTASQRAGGATISAVQRAVAATPIAKRYTVKPIQPQPLPQQTPVVAKAAGKRPTNRSQA